ncbi:MAG: response regulator, partial [Clostridia bacterium]|nr:response regulator [Clostridia bacterium]
RMPEMDGLEAASRIRALDRPDAGTVPIIALTANAFDEDVQRSLQAGMNAHLSKPVEPEHLFRTLEELIWEARNKK